MKTGFYGKSAYVCVLVSALIVFLHSPCFADVWDMNVSIPDSDPKWSEFKTLWNNHWNGKNLDQTIECLKDIEKKYPSNLEAKLWLSKVYCIKAKHSHKKADYAQAESYAAKAHDIDSNSELALKLLVDAVPELYSFNEIMAKYGKWIKSAAPLPVGEALPPMTNMPEWDKFYQLWFERYEIDKAVQAVKMLDDYAAKKPGDGQAQAWACRGNYYIGEYWSSLNQHETKAMPYYKKGIIYGEKSKKLLPYGVPATYWYQLNLARSLQYANIFTKAKYIKTFVGLLMFCSYENALYYYYGPNLTLGTMITNAGWVAEQGMGIAGVSLKKEMTSLEIAGILYPDYLYIPYAKADVLAYKGKKKEAIKILEGILASSTEKNKYAIAENRCHQRFSRMLYDKLK
jgi:tetratricopeptide (TPR) repeat protein